MQPAWALPCSSKADRGSREMQPICQQGTWVFISLTFNPRGSQKCKRAQFIWLITSINLKFPSRTKWFSGAQSKVKAGQGAGEHGEVLSPKPAPEATREPFPVPGSMVRAGAGSPTEPPWHSVNQVFMVLRDFKNPTYRLIHSLQPEL